jgi:RHS repeat-associated protein
LGTFTFNQRFAGQVYDQETGLFQNWNREYNAQQGRYDQFDPIGLAGGLDRRGYVDGNPLSKIDPLGLAGIMLGGRIEEPVVIDNDSSCKLMFPPPRVDDSGCISMAGGPSICIGPGAIKGLTAGAQRVLGNLSSFANSTVATAIRARGGSAANITRLESGMGQRTVGEIAEAAAKGDAAAVQAIKMIKQASTKGQRY